MMFLLMACGPSAKLFGWDCFCQMFDCRLSGQTDSRENVSEKTEIFSPSRAIAGHHSAFYNGSFPDDD